MSLIAYIDPTGIHAPTYQDVYSALIAQYQAIFGADVYLGNDSQDGQLIGIFAQAIADANNALVANYNAYSPATAQGAGLSSQVKINGLARLVPSNSTAVMTLVGQAGTIINNGIVQDNAGNQWALPTLAIIGLSGTLSITATCTVPGAINAQANAITQIVTPTLGWQSATNPAAAVPGSPTENDATLRIRQSVSTAQPANSVIASISAAVGNVPSVGQWMIYENATGSTDANGVPAHSISPIVSGGTVSAIAAAIQSRKPPGIQTYGTTSAVVIDPVGLPITINFFQLAEVQIYVALTIHPLSGYLSTTGALIQNAMAAAINAMTIGETVYLSRLYAPATLSGDAATLSSGLTQAQLDALSLTYSITTLFIGTAPSPSGTSNIAIAFNAAAQSSVANISLTVA
jgi:uncharacterized phage protein gp47/JayE